MFPRVPADVEQGDASPFSDNDGTPYNKKKSQKTSYSPVIMVLQPHSSPNFSTPLRCKDFYTSFNSTCRICHEDDSPEMLISPCNCTGSLGRMHKKCLEKWLSMSNTDRCEICKYRFHVVYHTRHLGQWLVSNGAMGPKCFLGDLICLLVLLPLSVMSIYLCASGAHTYMSKYEWQATGLAFLCVFLLIALVLWSGLTFRFHYLRFRDWQESNLIIQVISHPKEVQYADVSSSNLEERLSSSPNLQPQEQYTSISESEYNYSINTCGFGIGPNSMVETRL